MTNALTQSNGVRIGKRALHQMRATLERETGPKAALLLREIGFAAGDGAYQAFEEWCRSTYQVGSARELDTAFLREALTGFFAEAGWGSVTMSELTPTILALDGVQWSEAQAQGAEYPSCHFSCGLLADFFTRLGGTRAAVMEVECGSQGEERCRFLIGSPDMLTYLYERMTGGMSYQEAISGSQ
jgi:predicted hydrocarbon binding protein